MLIKTADKHNTRVIETLKRNHYYFYKKLKVVTLLCMLLHIRGQGISLFDQSLTDDDEHNRNATSKRMKSIDKNGDECFESNLSIEIVSKLCRDTWSKIIEFCRPREWFQ